MAAKEKQKPRQVVNCRILPRLVERLDELAQADRRSRSELIEMAVEEFVQKRTKKK